MADLSLLGLREVASRLGVHHTTLRRWLSQGRLQGYRLRKRIFVRPEEVAEFIEKGRICDQTNDHAA